jgi:UDP:flavonoid glycosyltransferase YjiC (YdhE family)
VARITVVSMAFWGDVMPFVPIANELAGRGHNVTFAVPEGFWPMLANEAFSLWSLSYKCPKSA